MIQYNHEPFNDTKYFAGARAGITPVMESNSDLWIDPYPPALTLVDLKLYTYLDYLHDFSEWEKNGCLFDAQFPKLSSDEFNRLKAECLRLWDNNAKSDATEKRKAFLQTRLLLNDYQHYRYYDYVESYNIAAHRRVSDLSERPLDKKEFHATKIKFLRSIVARDWGGHYDIYNVPDQSLYAVLFPNAKER